MTYLEANQIFVDYGTFLAKSFAKINMLFQQNIPESFLPYPKDQLEEALNIVDRHYFDTKDKHKQDMTREVMMLLELFKDDEEAVIETAKNFNNPEWRKYSIPAFKNMQKEWLKIDKSNPFEKG
jgi:hypothetical protein